MDDARAWDERLGWAYGLIADDPAERAAALDHLVSSRKNALDAQLRFNEAWLTADRLGVKDRWEEPVFRDAHQEYRRVQSHSLPEAFWSGVGREDLVEWPGLPYALVFLEWEARYPEEWTRHAKAWGTKEVLIRDLARVATDASVGPDSPVTAKLIDLVEVVVQRAYRCKDREYVRVARAVDGDELRGRLELALRSENPWAQLHAGYVLWLLDRPEVPNTRHVWRTWLADGRQ
jgi:hypothetical protein